MAKRRRAELVKGLRDVTRQAESLLEDTDEDVDAGIILIICSYLAVLTLIQGMSSLRSLIPFIYTCLKHQLMHQLYSSALPWIILCCMHDVGSSVVITFQAQLRRAAWPAVYAHVHILADHVTLSIG